MRRYTGAAIYAVVAVSIFLLITHVLTQGTVTARAWEPPSTNALVVAAAITVGFLALAAVWTWWRDRK
jgi:uncharacterized protein involved in response to NO